MSMYERDAFGNYQPKRQRKFSAFKNRYLGEKLALIFLFIAGLLVPPFAVMVVTAYFHAKYPVIPELGLIDGFIIYWTYELFTGRYLKNRGI